MAELHQVTINTANDAPQPTLEELAAKMDEQAPPPSEDRPGWLPEKFKDAEDMAKAYSELEKKLGGAKAQEPETPSADESGKNKEENPPETVEDLAKKAVEKADLNLDELSSKFWENGNLDDTDFESLEKAGYPRHIVDAFIAGQQALVSQNESQMMSIAGGADNYKDLVGWAAESLGETEIEAYNKAVNSGDLDTASMAIKGLKARYDAAVGYEPTRQIQSDGKSASVVNYRSVAELQKDMSDPRYKSDPAFRKDVEQKLGRSDIF